MDLLDALAEARIREAQQRGDLQGLAGAGEPLRLDDLSMVPESLRPAWLLLRIAATCRRSWRALRSGWRWKIC